MKKIMILLGLITSLLGSSQALASETSSDLNLTIESATGLYRVLDCSLMDDSSNGHKFAALGYVITAFKVTLRSDQADLTLVQDDGTSLAIGTGGYLMMEADLIQMGWDENEHWAELTKEGKLYSGTVTLEEDFAFAVTCSERL